MAGTISGTALAEKDAEWSVIGSMLIDARCVPAVLAAVREEDFGDPSCRTSFAAIREQFLAGKPVDPVLIHERIGGGERWVNWIRDVMTLTPTAANAAYYAGLVRDNAVLRRFRSKCSEGLSCADTGDREGAKRAALEMAGLFAEQGRGRSFTAAELMGEFWGRMRSPEKPEYLPWGIPSLDRALWAERGDMIVLGGYASAGKTLLSIQMALAQAKRYRVVYYTLETTPEKMADRIVAHLAPVPLAGIKTRSLGAEELSRAAQAAGLFVDRCPVTVVHAAHFTADEIAADALSKRAEVVYIDYLQLIESANPKDTDYARVSKVSRSLKIFGQTHGVAVVALAQLSRPEKGKKGDGERVPPDMHAFRESGQIEQDADVAMLVWRKNENDNDGSQRVLKIAKNKEGRRKTITLDFDGATQTMTEAEEPEGKRVAAELAAHGRYIKAANRAAARMEQMEFTEITGGDEENPFVKK